MRLRTMNKITPKILYKYRDCAIDTHWKSLREQVVWCGTLDNYNDPYEGYTTVNFLPVYKNFLKNKTPDNGNSQIDLTDDLEKLVNLVALQLNRTTSEVENQILQQKNSWNKIMPLLGIKTLIKILFVLSLKNIIID